MTRRQPGDGTRKWEELVDRPGEIRGPGVCAALTQA